MTRIGPNRVGSGLVALSLAENPELQRAVAESENRERAVDMLTALRQVLGPSIAPHLVADVIAAVREAGTPRHLGEGLIAPVHAQRALAVLSQAPSPYVSGLLAETQSAAERAVLLKAIGARAELIGSNVALAEIGEVARRIRGKPRAWLVANTTAYGLPASPKVPNRVPNACVSNSAHVAWMEASVLETLRVREAPARAAVAQLDDLQHGLEKRTAFGAWCAAALNTAPLSLEQSIHVAGAGVGKSYVAREWLDESKRQTSLDELEGLVRDGYDLYVRYALDTTQKAWRSHMVLIVDCIERGGERVWLVHDGKSDGPTTALEMRDRDFLEEWGGVPHRFVLEVYVPERDR